MMARAAALAATLLSTMLSTMPQTTPQTTQAGLKTLEQGALSGVDEPRQVVARTGAEWTRLWQEHGRERQRPAVNFAKDLVLGVFMGSRPSGGFRVEILSATTHGGKLVVRYRETTPDREAVTAQIITSAYHLVTMPTFSGDVTFEKAEPGK